MIKALVLCRNCREIFTNEETYEHKRDTGHNSWSVCYEPAGASVMWLFKKWLILQRTDYQELIKENSALKRKVIRQAEIIVGMKNEARRNKK